MKNTIVKKLKSQVDSLVNDLLRQEEISIQLRTKLERFEKEEEKIKEVSFSRKQEMENQVEWLRGLIADIVTPKEKLDSIIKIQQQQIDLLDKGLDPTRLNFPLKRTW